MTMQMKRREFILGAAAFASSTAAHAFAAGKASATPQRRSAERQAALVDRWNDATMLVAPEDYKAYYKDGDTRNFAALKALEHAFDKVKREVAETIVGSDAPAVWSIYNMGYIVKTRHATFSIDLKHRRAKEFAPLLDFALCTHAHGDHFDGDFLRAMDSAGKKIVSNFHANNGAEVSGLMKGENILHIKDISIRTFSVDHASEPWGIDFTTAFEIAIGGFRLLHTGDCRPSNDKLAVKWGAPDLWLLFPMSGLDIADAMRRIHPKRVVFGHLWELGHKQTKGRAHKWHINRAMPPALANCPDISVGFWGDRIS